MEEVPYYPPNETTLLPKNKKAPSFGIGERMNIVSRNTHSPPPGSYKTKSIFSAKKIKNKCYFGLRLQNTKKLGTPGPGSYKPSSFVNNPYAKKFTIKGRIGPSNIIYIYIYMNMNIEKIKNQHPGPIYKQSSSLTENNKYKGITFGIGDRTYLNKQMLRTESPGPIYSLNSAFDSNLSSSRLGSPPQSNI